MVETVARTAAAWSIVCAAHDGVDGAGSGCCVIERHFQGRREAREGEVEELASFRPRLSRAASRRKMLRRLETGVGRIVYRSSRPECTLLAVSYLLCGGVNWAMCTTFGTDR
jgi:hypothetical protein